MSDLESGWDLVIGHSLGGLIAAHAAAHDPGFTQPADPDRPGAGDRRRRDFPAVLESVVDEARNPPTAEAIRAENPGWHDECVRAKALAGRQVDPDAVERTLRDNAPWRHGGLMDRLTVPALILGGDPALGGMTAPDLGAGNPLVEYRMVAGTGHSVHRDRPDLVLAAV